MKNFIYYPHFEIRDLNWIKFALLYFSKLSTIIPYEGEKYLSEDYIRLRGSTDLFESYRPSYIQGQSSTLDAIRAVDGVILHPNRYSFIFGTRDIVSEWRNPNSQNYTIFQSKYSVEWERFCLENKFAQRCNEGILLNKDLAHLYMSLLAATVAENSEYSIITDEQRYDKMSALVRQAGFKHENQTVQNLELVRSVINLKIPSNISEIDISQIIKLRNRSGFQEKLNAFNKELDEFSINFNTTNNPRNFIDSLGSTIGDLSADILELGGNLTSVGVGTWLAVSNINFDLLGSIKELSGTLLITSGVMKLNDNWDNCKSKRFARKYLSDLSNLSKQA